MSQSEKKIEQLKDVGINVETLDSNNERSFIHEIANPLGTALILSETLLEDLESHSDLDPDEKARIAKLNLVLEQLKILIQKRRADLINRELKSTGTDSARP